MSFKNGRGRVSVYIKVVSEMLGHTNVGITLKIYHHVNAKIIKQVHQEYSPLRAFSAIDVLV